MNQIDITFDVNNETTYLNNIVIVDYDISRKNIILNSSITEKMNTKLLSGMFKFENGDYLSINLNYYYQQEVTISFFKKQPNFMRNEFSGMVLAYWSYHFNPEPCSYITKNVTGENKSDLNIKIEVVGHEDQARNFNNFKYVNMNGGRHLSYIKPNTPNDITWDGKSC